jgi:acetylornithine deacetylase/succinyl-diaminopimelate desuccinylase-like protein
VAERRDPQALVVPAVLSGFTDSHYFRRKGIVSYGFTGLAIEETESRRVHGIDERLSLTSLREGVQVLMDVIGELGR